MTKRHVLMTGPLMRMVMEQLDSAYEVHRLWEAKDRDRFLDAVADKIEAIAVGPHTPVDGALMSRLPKLKIVANFGVGYDTVDARWAGQHGIIVTNTPDVLTEEVADTTLGLILMTVRRLSEAERWLRAGKWASEGAFPLTPSLRDRRVGIVGLGRIGKAIARRLDAFRVPVVYHGRREQRDVDYGYYPDLVAMARDVDVLVAVAPGGAETKHMISTAVLDALGPDGILINVGRGSVVDEQALIAALRDRRILSAGLDVFENEPHVPAELIAMDHVVLLPHVGSASVHTRNRMGQLVVDNIRSYFETGKPLTPVPETPVPAT
ncbi:lactate dehydrogenase-like 2-hydroxyacid dehydrogenase [Tepidamorphus gemmatus]|jgi:lactate dehydrogenase-like 2-hydroxyacid dehydrogenase|uniref:Lactate dehydrogenase-like 2-hydroxyacid dehydrogenase n=1 Tax=Tepidamorphus gemmatus TaxID=747076 RepID=A0A4R3LY05_9HYPH|nr:2-hydroxyacid dehydrogenase [Tepidamorphus gemmatus]TCT05433.1 lactate dehydrogenase-like 2-hydroxyacid dehydrogenase [Tepidamorphus gemmatus]